MWLRAPAKRRTLPVFIETEAVRVNANLMCIQCGADTGITKRFARMAVCPYCRSVLIVIGDAVRRRGEAAVLVEADSPFFVGETGDVAGRPFAVHGRLHYSEGRAEWDEWFVTIDGEPAWISDDGGDWRVTREEPVSPGDAAALAAAAPGAPVVVNGGKLLVEEQGRARLIGFEGGVPAEYEAGAPYAYTDAVTTDGRVVTLERRADGDRLFAGRVIAFDDVRFDHTMWE